MVRRLTFDAGRLVYYDDEAITQQTQEFSIALSHLDGLEDVEFHDFPPDAFPAAFSAISSSQPRSHISSLTASGGSSARPDCPLLDEDDLIRVLHTLPSLASFSCKSSHLRAPSWPATGLPTLPLHQLRIGNWRYRVPQDDLQPSSPISALAGSFSLAPRLNLTITRGSDDKGWMRWAASGAFTSLRSLSVLSMHPPFDAVLTALPAASPACQSFGASGCGKTGSVLVDLDLRCPYCPARDYLLESTSGSLRYLRASDWTYGRSNKSEEFVITDLPL
ncbi:hypothetical protein JCM10213v2_009074 [Rhodosporidiobolus nylandii]